MKKFRRHLYKSDTKMVRTAVREILSPIYYRHEFARRWDDVSAEGQRVLKLLLGSAEHGATFVCPEPGVFLTDRLIAAFRGATRPLSTQMHDQLRDFLRNKAVIPMSQPNGPFFPNPEACDANLLWQIWKALVYFEFFALARLDVGQPFLFPVMYVGPVAVPEDLNLYGLLDMEAGGYPLLMDFRMPNDLLLNYLRAFGALTLESSTEVTQVAQSKQEYERHWERLRAEPLDAILEAHDLALNGPSEIQEKERRMREIYNRRFPDPNPNASMKTIYRTFDDWLERAEEFKKDYKFFI